MRFTVADFRAPREYTIVESLRVPVRLGHGAFVTNRLEPELIERAVEAIGQFRERMDALAVEHHRAIATSAVRESENGGELISRTQEATGIRIEPITGVEEGRLVWLAIRSRVELAGAPWLLADLGGGSLEVTLAESGARAWTRSLALGTVRMLERLEREGGLEQEAEKGSTRRTLEDYADGLLASLPALPPVKGVLATGGNAEVLAELAVAQPDGTGVRRVSLTWLREIIDRLATLTFAERINQLNLREDRADIIFPAAIVYARLAAQARVEELIIPGVGLKEGVLLDLVDKLAGQEAHQAAQAREVEEGAVALGRHYRFDEAHARQVARFCVQLFDELAELHALAAADRRVLLTAALLHDCGKLIANRRHHKHSSYLIRNAELPGLTPSEIDLAALVARYHRGPAPKKTHDRYGALEKPERRRVKKLAALLRLGDALDQQHGQEVRTLRVDAHDEEITLFVRAGGDVALEDWGFKRKRKLFEKVFDRQVRVVVE